MIRLEHIKKTDDVIVCVGFIEDCKEPVQISVNRANYAMTTSPLPKGYEWGTSHLEHAKKALIDILESGSNETKRTVMWY